MASSRWKRFAFFERHTLSLASEVLEDLIPIGSEGRASRRSVKALAKASDEANDSISVVASTASLPLNSKPERDDSVESPETSALSSMWSSLNACTATELPENEFDAIKLSSQAASFEDLGISETSTTTAALDGLVLVFLASKETDHVHCFDVTMRCNPSESSSNWDFCGGQNYIRAHDRGDD